MLESSSGRVHLLFCAQTLCMNFVIAMFLVFCRMSTGSHVSYFVRLIFVLCTPKPKHKEQIHISNNFIGCHNYFPLLTMFWLNRDVFTQAILYTRLFHCRTC